MFLPLVQAKKAKSIHWFDPFGSVQYEHMCHLPPIAMADHRYIFYDQEPLHKNLVADVFSGFHNMFEPVTTKNITIITSEKNSEDVQWVCDTYGVTSQYYFFHGWAALDWYRGYNKTFLHRPKNIKHTYLFPNNIIGGERKHRLELFRELEKRNIVKNNLVSLPEICPYENKSAQQLCAEYGLGSIETRLPLKIDDYDNHANNSHRIDMWDLSSRSLVQVVSETVFRGNKNHLTEKSFKPIVLKQPFIIASCRGSLEYLKSYGFETFSSVWDESYDTLPDDQRISAIGNLLQELEYADWKYLNELCAPIVQHNYDWFYGGKFEQVLWDELLCMVESW